MIGKRLFRRYTIRVEDEKKIAAIKQRLIEETKSEAWDDVVGIFTLPLVVRNPQTLNYTVTLDQGLTTKAFVNTETGEFRFFSFKDVQKTIRIGGSRGKS
jgi:hypothetical protein